MAIQDAPPAGRGKVPVWRTAMESYGFVFGNLGRFFALGWLLLVIAAGTQIVGALVMGEPSGWGPETLRLSPPYILANILIAVVYYAMFLAFAVRWHRFYLLDERESVFSEILAARNWRFLGYTVVLTFAPIVPMLVFLLIGFGITMAGAGSVAAVPTGAALESLAFLFPLAGVVLVIVLFIVMFRFYLVLPATAVDRPLTLGEAWRNMRGNTWRYIGAIILVAIPMIIVGLILAALFMPFLIASMHGGGPAPSMTFIVVGNLVNTIFGFFATAVWITVLSTFYRHIVGMDAPEGGEGGAAVNSA